MDRDAGAMIRDGIKVMEKLGVCPASRRNGEAAWKRMVTWGFHGKIWENDGKMMMYGTSWPNWRSRSSVSRLAYGRTVWSRCFFSGILTLQFFKMASPVFRLRRNSGSTTTNMTSSRSNPTRVATRLGCKEPAPPSNYGAKSAWELNASFWLWMSLRRSSRKNHHETSSICMYCINVNINKIK